MIIVKRGILAIMQKRTQVTIVTAQKNIMTCFQSKPEKCFGSERFANLFCIHPKATIFLKLFPCEFIINIA